MAKRYLEIKTAVSSCECNSAITPAPCLLCFLWLQCHLCYYRKQIFKKKTFDLRFSSAFLIAPERVANLPQSVFKQSQCKHKISRKSNNTTASCFKNHLTFPQYFYHIAKSEATHLFLVFISAEIRRQSESC